MKENKSKIILWSIFFIFIYMVIYKICGKILKSFLGESYLICAVYDTLVLIAQYFLLKKFNMLHILKEKGKGFWYGIGVAGFEVVISVILCISNFNSGIQQNGKLESMFNILMFTIYMIQTGLTEEILFRGIIQNRIGKAYGTETRDNIIKTVVISGILFGMTHLFNIFSGATIGGTLRQVIAVCGMGMYLGAIYYRCNNIYSVAIVHGFSDFANLIGSGIFGNGTIADEISGYGQNGIVMSFVSLLLYGGLAMFLLRKSKVSTNEVNNEIANK